MKNFKLYGVLDTQEDKLVSNLVNPKRKFWEKKQFAVDAARKGNRRYQNRYKVVEIECKAREI